MGLMNSSNTSVTGHFFSSFSTYRKNINLFSRCLTSSKSSFYFAIFDPISFSKFCINYWLFNSFFLSILFSWRSLSSSRSAAIRSLPSLMFLSRTSGLSTFICLILLILEVLLTSPSVSWEKCYYYFCSAIFAWTRFAKDGCLAIILPITRRHLVMVVILLANDLTMILFLSDPSSLRTSLFHLLMIFYGFLDLVLGRELWLAWRSTMPSIRPFHRLMIIKDLYLLKMAISSLSFYMPPVQSTDWLLLFRTRKSTFWVTDTHLCIGVA